MSVPAPHKTYVAEAGERYRDAHRRLAAALKATFPTAKAVFSWGMPGWVLPRPEGAPAPQGSGTMDPMTTFVGLVERKAALTLHLWYPGDPDVFGAHVETLRAAGLKAGRGCLVHGRKEPFPVDAVATILTWIQRKDAAGAKAAQGA